MQHPSTPLIRIIGTAGLAAFCFTGVTGCASHLASKPGVFDTRKVEVTILHQKLHLTSVKPKTPKAPKFLVLFATGDAGWLGASKTVFEHLAEQGYYVAGYNSREALKKTKRSGELITVAEGNKIVAAMITEAKKSLGLPDETRTIPTGDSRGASVAVFIAADPALQPRLAGAVAIALTRELDYLKVKKSALSSTIQVDEKGRLQTYPALPRIGPLPLAVIQSTGDKYVTAAEARKLFGPDTPTRRLYSVEARNHGFSGGRDQLLHDLDDAMAWVLSVASADTHSAPQDLNSK